MMSAAVGDLDDIPDLMGKVASLEARCNRLRSVIVRTNDNSHYWYKLWLGMGTEFHRGQELLVAEIDRLKKKAGEWDGQSHLDAEYRKYLQRMKDDWVEPQSHPANRSLDDVESGIDAPPRGPDELIADAERG
jgi:hypothetical protein